MPVGYRSRATFTGPASGKASVSAMADQLVPAADIH